MAYSLGNQAIVEHAPTEFATDWGFSTGTTAYNRVTASARTPKKSNIPAGAIKQPTTSIIMPPYGEPDWATPGDTSKANVSSGLPPMSLSGSGVSTGGTNVNSAAVS